MATMMKATTTTIMRPVSKREILTLVLVFTEEPFRVWRAQEREAPTSTAREEGAAGVT
jgi:hypothetical protein